jgi:hypothetical protein
LDEERAGAVIKTKGYEKKTRSSCLHFHDINFPGFLTAKRALKKTHTIWNE